MEKKAYIAKLKYEIWLLQTAALPYGEPLFRTIAAELRKELKRVCGEATERAG